MRIKNLPSIESMNGSQDALVIEQTDGSEDKSRKVSPAQIKQFIEAGDFEATGEVKDGHGNILKNMAKIKVTEKNIKLSTSGHSAPVRSAAGVYYEALVNYATLGVTKDKILSVEIINWDGITHSFNLYLGGNTISAMSDSANSIYSGSGSFVDLRVVYRE